jgi:hypothetical protein
MSYEEEAAGKMAHTAQLIISPKQLLLYKVRTTPPPMWQDAIGRLFHRRYAGRWARVQHDGPQDATTPTIHLSGFAALLEVSLAIV